MGSRARFRRWAADGSGQASVEFALVVPLLLLLVVGLLQGIVLGVQAARIDGAAREAARAAAVGRDAAGVREAAARGGGGLDPSRLSVTVPSLPATAGQPVTVTVSYQPRLFIPGLEHLGLGPPHLTASATMVAE